MSNDLSLREPNEEQKLAIEHRGGVLLSAGAGSGKTFVLVEHIIYLVNEFCRENQSLDQIQFSRELKDYLSKIVLMTFTKKAAGELFLRMKKRFVLAKERAKEGMEEFPHWMWTEAELALPYLYIGTIHGFCYRLINQGYIEGFSGNEEMVSDVEFRSKIDTLVDQWLDENFNDFRENGLEHLILNKKALKKNFAQIFSDTDIRLLWSQTSVADLEYDNELKWFEECLELVLGSSYSDFEIDARLYEPEKKKPKWFDFMVNLNSTVSGKPDVMSFMKSAQSFFELNNRFPPVKKGAVPEEVFSYYQKAKALRDFLKNNYESIVSFEKKFDLFSLWGSKILELYQFIEDNYFQEGGLTFTDLEFYVWRALEGSQDTVERVSASYNYFIIDEFQDTSKVQFSIVSNIINGDMAKVFSVGDVKQAIYGFRGGELGVFQEASEKTYQNLSLRKNYRSSERVIEFNNILFRKVLPLGKEYQGEDPFSVEMISQEFPENKDHIGTLEKKCILIEGGEEKKKSLLPTELNLIESVYIANYIKNCDEEVAVLYRKLAPTKYLIPELMSAGVGFTCQVKVELSEDPFLSLFLEFSRACAFRENENEFKRSLVVLRFITEKMGSSIDLDSIKEIFFKESKIGVYSAFKEFLWVTGLSSSNLATTFPLITVLKDLAKDRASVVFEYCKTFLNGNYSLDFQYGLNPQRVKIMTVHASKGLEFETVILGGIHTNGSTGGSSDAFGKLPLSLTWFAGLGKSELYKSPAYLYEEEVKRLKEFSEFKRLFYVATTRAVDKLLWMDLSYKGVPVSYSKSSWINGIRLVENSIDEESKEILSIIKEEMKSEECRYEDLIVRDSLSLDAPMFHRDNLGIYYPPVSSEEYRLGTGAELSVTRLATLKMCPRKFYLKNVLKLSTEECSFFEVCQENSTYEENDIVEEEGQGVFDILSSSAARGSLVHEEIEYAIKHNLVRPMTTILDEQTSKGVDWIIEELKALSENSNLVSEEPLKFSLFGQMISGIPDLVIYSKEGIVTEIWDFKTGRYNEEKSKPYWLQLEAYGYGLTHSGFKNEVKLVLAFIDEKELVVRSLDRNGLEESLFETWQQLSNLERTNQEHCKQCEYSQLCQLN